MHLLGLDIGTTGCKSIIYTLDGRIVSQAYRENKIHHPKPGWAEYKVDEIWSNVKEALKESLTKSKLDPKEVAGLSISSQAETLIPVDHDGKWLYSAIVWLDQRGEEQCKWWEENFGKYNLYRITGQHLHPTYTVNKIMWLR
ncbi:MAG: FGGY family carbohydrate kinase, partial [Candidatus Hodarchaeota archaeon]